MFHLFRINLLNTRFFVTRPIRFVTRLFRLRLGKFLPFKSENHNKEQHPNDFLPTTCNIFHGRRFRPKDLHIGLCGTKGELLKTKVLRKNPRHRHTKLNTRARRDQDKAPFGKLNRHTIQKVHRRLNEAFRKGSGLLVVRTLRYSTTVHGLHRRNGRIKAINMRVRSVFPIRDRPSLLHPPNQTSFVPSRRLTTCRAFHRRFRHSLLTSSNGLLIFRRVPDFERRSKRTLRTSKAKHRLLFRQKSSISARTGKVAVKGRHRIFQEGKDTFVNSIRRETKARPISHLLKALKRGYMVKNFKLPRDVRGATMRKVQVMATLVIREVPRTTTRVVNQDNIRHVMHHV